MQRLVKASHETLELLFQTVKPGRTAHEVAGRSSKALKDVSAEAYWTGMYGYSMGLGFPPTWREVITCSPRGWTSRSSRA